jgi:hypothetical protein
MMNGVTGCVVRGRGDYAANSIFLPCVGYSDGVSLNGFGEGGLCWSSVPDPGGYSPDGYFSWFLNWSCGIGSVSHYMGSYISLYRYHGFSVRPVQDGALSGGGGGSASGDDVRYELSDSAKDRAIASVTVDDLGGGELRAEARFLVGGKFVVVDW